MSSDPHLISVTGATSLADVLDEAAGAPVRLERNGIVYRITREQDDPFANYDPEAVREGLRRIAGVITPEEAKTMKELVYRGREEGTRALNRP